MQFLLPQIPYSQADNEVNSEGWSSIIYTHPQNEQQNK
jgi:hypothetical protein